MPLIRFASIMILLFTSIAQSPGSRAEMPSALLSASGLRADVDVLERAYLALHPGLYR